MNDVLFLFPSDLLWEPRDSKQRPSPVQWWPGFLQLHRVWVSGRLLRYRPTQPTLLSQWHLDRQWPWMHGWASLPWDPWKTVVLGLHPDKSKAIQEIIGKLAGVEGLSLKGGHMTNVHWLDTCGKPRSCRLHFMCILSFEWHPRGSG